MNDLIDLQKQIAILQKRAEEVRSKELASTIAEIRAKMTAFGITTKDLLGVKPKGKGRFESKKATVKVAKKPKSPAPIKFRGPNGEGWSGRGLMPRWMKVLTENGKTKEEFKVNDQ